MKFLVVELVLAALVGGCFSVEDTFGDDMDYLLRKLRETSSTNDHVMSRNRFVEDTILLKNNEVLQRLDTRRIILEGIENMKRTSPAIGEVCRCMVQTVDRVQFSVARGINMTTSLKFEAGRQTYSAQLFMRWKSPAEAAVFNLKKVSFGGEKYKVDETSNNIFNDKFDINLICDDVMKQEKCNQLKNDYLENPADFDVHRYFQSIFENAINKMYYD